MYGEDRFGQHVERRHDLAATTRRVLARAGRPTVRRALAVPFVVAGIAATLAGLATVGIYFAALAVAVYLASDRLPDELFEEPDAKVNYTHSKVPGMGDREVSRRLGIHSKREEVREEKVEEERRRQERKAKAGQGH